MINTTWTRRAALLAGTVLLGDAILLAGVPALAQTPATTVFEGARLITGDGGAIENSAFTVIGNRFAAVGRRGEVTVPAGVRRVDLTGKTVMPALVDDHVHMGYRKGTSFSADNYTRENLLDMLDRYAFYGVAAVLETGTGRGDLPYKVRGEAHTGARYLTTGSGFGMPNAGPGGAMRDSAYGVTNEARRAVTFASLPPTRPTWSRSGSMIATARWTSSSQISIGAIIDEAHKYNLRVMAHTVELADAKDLLRAGIDAFAHMVRDKAVDDELLGLLKERPARLLPGDTMGGETGDLHRKARLGGRSGVARSIHGGRHLANSASNSPPIRKPIRRQWRARGRWRRTTCAIPSASMMPACASGSAPIPAG